MSVRTLVSLATLVLMAAGCSGESSIDDHAGRPDGLRADAMLDRGLSPDGPWRPGPDAGGSSPDQQGPPDGRQPADQGPPADFRATFTASITRVECWCNQMPGSSGKSNVSMDILFDNDGGQVSGVALLGSEFKDLWLGGVHPLTFTPAASFNGEVPPGPLVVGYTASGTSQSLPIPCNGKIEVSTRVRSAEGVIGPFTFQAECKSLW